MKAWVLAQKDLRVYFRDRVAVLLGFGLPIVLCTVFAGAMGAIGGGDTVGRVELVVYDADRSDASRALVAGLAEAKGLKLDVLAPAPGDGAAAEDGAPEDGDAPEDAARERVAEGDAPAGLRIGAGFGAALASGADLPLVLYRDPGKTIEQQILAGNLIPAFLEALGDDLGPRMGKRILDTIDFPLLGRERAEAILDSSWTNMAGLVEELRASDVDGAADEEDEETPESAQADTDHGKSFDFASGVAGILGIRIEDVVGGEEAAEDEKRGMQAYSIAGMAVMMLLFGLVHCGGTLLDEEEEGTLDRLRLAPGASSAILTGKCIFTWIVGLVELLILFVYGKLVFDLDVFRAPLALVVLSAVTAAAVTGFGVLFAVLARSRKQLEGLSTIVVLTMSALGGSWWPLAITPEWYQTLGHFTLNAWAMDGYQGIFWYGKGLAGILPEIGVLVGIALGTSLLAWRLWERRMRV